MERRRVDGPTRRDVLAVALSGVVAPTLAPAVQPREAGQANSGAAPFTLPLRDGRVTLPHWDDRQGTLLVVTEPGGSTDKPIAVKMTWRSSDDIVIISF
jgi:hypothetical protein